MERGGSGNEASTEELSRKGRDCRPPSSYQEFLFPRHQNFRPPLLLFFLLPSLHVLISYRTQCSERERIWSWLQQPPSLRNEFMPWGRCLGNESGRVVYPRERERETFISPESKIWGLLVACVNVSLSGWFVYPLWFIYRMNQRARTGGGRGSGVPRWKRFGEQTFGKGFLRIYKRTNLPWSWIYLPGIFRLATISLRCRLFFTPSYQGINFRSEREISKNLLSVR